MELLLIIFKGEEHFLTITCETRALVKALTCGGDIALWEIKKSTEISVCLKKRDKLGLILKN